MKCRYDINDKKAIKLLSTSKRFEKYPEIFLSNTCQVKVNPDDCLIQDEFTVHTKCKILPRKIYLYGKRDTSREEDNLYLNYWMAVFLKTVEKGNLYKADFFKSNSKLELTIGLPIEYRNSAFDYHNWTRSNVITFLMCLFDCTLEEVNYEQQDLLDLVA